MTHGMTRRKALTAGAVSTGLFAGAGPAFNQNTKKGPALSRSKAWEGNLWSRGPDRNLVRDLKPGPTPIRLACSSRATRLWYPTDKSITEAVKSIRDQGYTAAGVSNHLGSHNKWLDASDSEIAELKAALKEYDVDFFDHMTADNLIHPDSTIRKKVIRHVTENVEAAERCGGGAVCAGLGSRDPDNGLGMHPDNWTAETWKLGVEGVKQILKDTAGYKSVLGMEAVVTTPLDGPEAHLRLIEDVGDPRCQVALDSANMFTVANYFHSTEMLNRCFDMLGENIANCHAKDTVMGRGMLVHLDMIVAGKGVQDYETYLVRMSRMKRTRVLMLEFGKDEEYPEAKAFIERTAEKVGVKIYS
ncbi:sugar phosphate isomerase/epimerase [bacterium]|nr:sugar phosphate isomerase/epimerase [bacterium]